MSAYFVLTIVSLVAGIVSSENFTTVVKCCDDGSVLNERLTCEKLLGTNTDNETLYHAVLNMTNNGTIHPACFKNGEGGKLAEVEGDKNNNTCVDILANGTKLELICTSRPFDVNENIKHCDSLLTPLRFWGANMVILATMIYNVPFVIVVIIYCAFPELRTRAYDKGVICFNMCYIVINFILITLGVFTLGHKTLSVTALRLFGLSLMFTTQGTVFWTLVLCFDMTLVITRFRWAPKSGVDRGREEKRKFLIYSSWAWGFSAFLTLIPAVVEFTSIFPEDSPIRPNFHHFRGTNVAVIIYVMTGPALVCMTTTSLFIYTTVKTIAVQKSTAIINENRKNNVKKKYLMFLKLYIVMDTPWLTSALAAIFKDLWVLKFIKMVQPIVMLLLIIPRKRVLRAISCRKDKAIDEKEAERLNKDTCRKTNLQTRRKIDQPVNH